MPFPEGVFTSKNIDVFKGEWVVCYSTCAIGSANIDFRWDFPPPTLLFLLLLLECSGTFQIWCPHRRGEGTWKSRCRKGGCLNFSVNQIPMQTKGRGQKFWKFCRHHIWRPPSRQPGHSISRNPAMNYIERSSQRKAKISVGIQINK